MSRQEEISKAAYELYEKSGCAHGQDVENWLVAEQQVMAVSKPVKRRRAVKKAPTTRTRVTKKRAVKK